MKSVLYLLFSLISVCSFAQNAPERTPNGGGEVIFENTACLTPEERKEIEQMLADNVAQLKKDGLLPEVNERLAVSFDWPLQPAANLDYNSYYYISNYVDQNSASGILDYDCGNRSYNGHQGIDIGTWPFPWDMVANNLVEVIAGEAGTIIGKSDGNDDNHCSCFGTWNAVFVQHGDGSIAWYGHMKKNSLTTKSIGQAVDKGEYLGIVASSGCSTGPHLHFEVYEALPYQPSNLIEPFAGPCNGMNTQSWWAVQKPYREPTLNVNLTHSAAPVQGCPGNNETPHFSNTFTAGSVAYFANYYHDQLQGHVSTHVIRRPNGTVWQSWNHTSPGTYTLSWWWWSWVLPVSGPNGTWTFETTYQGQTLIHEFTVTGALPVSLTRFNAQLNKHKEVELTWETETERDNDYFAVERGRAAGDFIDIGTVGGNGTTNQKKTYSYKDKHPLPGTNFYRLRQVDFDGQDTYSDVLAVQIGSTARYFASPNPTLGMIHISGDIEAIESIHLYDAMGKLVKNNVPAASVLDLSDCPHGIYYLEITYDVGMEQLRILRH